MLIVGAALNVALLAIPQGMAYALVSGLPIQYGLLGSAVAAVVGCLFSNSRFITLGPTNATAVLLFGVFASLGMINHAGMASEQALLLLPWDSIFFRDDATPRIISQSFVYDSICLKDGYYSLCNCCGMSSSSPIRQNMSWV